MRGLSLLTLVLMSQMLFAQIAPDTYYVQFSDKNNSPFSIDNPSAFLSQRAIERRQKQQIAIIQNDIPVNPQYLTGVAGTGADLLYATKWLNGVTITTTSQDVLDAVNALPYVVSVRALTDQPLKQQIKEKAYFQQESYGPLSLPSTKSVEALDAYDYGSGYTQINQINGIPLHNMGFRGEEMVIAILDGGFIEVPTHQAFDSLWINNQILGHKDFVHPGGDVFTESYHGTAVLSTIGSNVAGQLVGTAPKASFWLLRSEYVLAENLIEEYNWVSAAEFADSVGADVINSSLGYITFDMPEWDHTYEDMDGNTCIVTIGADLASSKGILVVNSAGNSGSDFSYPYIGAPADGVNVFSIGAVDGGGNRASFSSIGPTFDGRIKPDVMAMGQGTAVATSGNSFSNGSGTSFSSPVTAGMSTCLWQANPTFTNLQIKEAIKQSGNYASAPDAYYGYGIPDYVLANSLLTVIDQPSSGQENLVQVYPNPVNETIQITIKAGAEALRLLDINGRLLNTFTDEATMSASAMKAINGLKPGVYFIQVMMGAQTQTRKLIKL